MVLLVVLLFWLLLPVQAPPVSAPVRPSQSEAEKAVPWTKEASPVGDLLLGHKPEGYRSDTGGHRRTAVVTGKSSAGLGVVTVVDHSGTDSTDRGASGHPPIGSRAPRRIGENAIQNGPGEREVARVVARSQSAFQFCIEQELRKNPTFRGGKVFITATVGPSGIVKSVRIGRRDIESSPLGSCLRARTERLVFPPFSGADAEVQVPLILTANVP